MISDNCSKKRIIDPCGVWNIEDLIGATVKIKSMPVSNFMLGFDCNTIYVVEQVQFRISIDGKAITILKLKDLDATFTLKDLEFIGVVDNTINPDEPESVNYAKCK